MPSAPQILLVAGFPRSGTTWCAQAVAAALGAPLVFEPYNWSLNPGGNPYQMRYLPTGAGDWQHTKVLRDALGRVDPPAEHAVVKDVHALLALGFLADRFPVRSTVVLVRHPCPVAASWRALGWEAGGAIARLLGQPDLMAAHLEPHAEHLDACRSDPWRALGAYWGATYRTMRELGAHDRVVRHEDLCADPVGGLTAVAAGIGVPVDAARLSGYLAEHDRGATEPLTPFHTYRSTGAVAEEWRATMDGHAARAVWDAAEPFGVAEGWYAAP